MAISTTAFSIDAIKSRSGIIPYLGIFVSFLVIYLLTLSHNLAASHDSVSYIYSIDRGDWVFHPHHLLYHPVSIVWLQLFRLLGITTESSLIVASLNAIAGAGTLTVLYFLLRTYFKNTVFASLSTIILIAFSFGFWFYSVCVEVYMIPLFFAILSLIFLLKPSINKRDLIWLAILQALAVLFHQTYIFLLLPTFVRLWFIPLNSSISRLNAFSRYIFLFSCIVGIAYITVMLWVIRVQSFIDAWLWLTEYSHQLSNLWNKPSLHSPMKAAIGISHSFLGGHFFFALPDVKEYFASVLSGHELRDDFFLVHTMPTWLATVLISTTVIIASIIIATVFRSISSLKLMFRSEFGLVLPLVIWLLSFSVFFFAWDPTNLEFWIPQSVLFWLLFDRFVVYKEHTGTYNSVWVRFLLPLLIFIVNYFGSINYLRSPDNDYFLVQTKALAQQVSGQDVVVTDRFWIVESYYQFYLSQPVYSPHDLVNEKSIVNKETSFRFQNDVRIALLSGSNVYVSFRIDSITTNQSLPPKFQDIWQSATANIPITITKERVGNETFWVAKQRES